MERRGHNLPLDDATAERLVTGAMAPGDAPPGYAPVARLLAGARRHLPVTALDDRLLGELVAAVGASSGDRGRSPSRLSRVLTAKVGAVAAVALLSTAGAAAAATGNLPGPAQEAVAGVADRIGIDLPTGADPEDELEPADVAEGDGPGTGADGGATGPDGGGTSGAQPPTGHADNPTEADAHGAAVSAVARTTEATGQDKGADVSGTARTGHGPGATSVTTVADEAADDDGRGDEQRGGPADRGGQAPDVEAGGADTGIDVETGKVAGRASHGAAAGPRP